MDKDCATKLLENTTMTRGRERDEEKERHSVRPRTWLISSNAEAPKSQTVEQNFHCTVRIDSVKTTAMGDTGEQEERIPSLNPTYGQPLSAAQ